MFFLNLFKREVSLLGIYITNLEISDQKFIELIGVIEDNLFLKCKEVYATTEDEVDIDGISIKKFTSKLKSIKISLFSIYAEDNNGKNELAISATNVNLTTCLVFNLSKIDNKNRNHIIEQIVNLVGIPHYGFIVHSKDKNLEHYFTFPSMIYNYNLSIDSISFNKNAFERWKLRSNKIIEGYFRDVFSVNILNQNHIENIEINGLNLYEYIVQNQTEYGSILLLASGLYIWELDKSQIKRGRELVYKSNFMI